MLRHHRVNYETFLMITFRYLGYLDLSTFVVRLFLFFRVPLASNISRLIAIVTSCTVLVLYSSCSSSSHQGFFGSYFRLSRSDENDILWEFVSKYCPTSHFHAPQLLGPPLGVDTLLIYYTHRHNCKLQLFQNWNTHDCHLIQTDFEFGKIVAQLLPFWYRVFTNQLKRSILLAVEADSYTVLDFFTTLLEI